MVPAFLFSHLQGGPAVLVSFNVNVSWFHEAKCCKQSQEWWLHFAKNVSSQAWNANLVFRCQITKGYQRYKNVWQLPDFRLSMIPAASQPRLRSHGHTRHSPCRPSHHPWDRPWLRFPANDPGSCSPELLGGLWINISNALSGLLEMFFGTE